MGMTRNKFNVAIAAVLTACLLGGCGKATSPEEVMEDNFEVVTEPHYVQQYDFSSSVVSVENETVLFQQRCGEGFLALINRKVKEDVPEELKEDPAFINDGQYDVYESALFRVTKSGKHEKVRRYQTLPAPENTEDLDTYYSEMRPRAFFVREDGCIIALESSMETWMDNHAYRSRDRYYVRVLKDNGAEVSTAEIETDGINGLNCSQSVCLRNDLFAVPQGREVLFFGTDGRKQFSVSTPFRIKELCATASGDLAVILQENGTLWLSVIEVSDRTVTVPSEIPGGSHHFSDGEEKDKLYFLRNSELFSYDLKSGEIRRLVSLLSLNILPSSVGAFCSDASGNLHFLLHEWRENGETIREIYEIAKKQTKETEKVDLTIGFEAVSDDLLNMILRFNRKHADIHIETIDYRNLEDAVLWNSEDIMVLDEERYRQLSDQNGLADLESLAKKVAYDFTGIIPEVQNAWMDDSGILRRISACFRIETMACDESSVNGKTELNIETLRSYYAMMATGSSLYEPYYTSERLLADLVAVNRKELGKGEQFNGELYAKLLSFSSVQPKDYSYQQYAANTESMESRIYNGTLLMIQADITNLTDLKRYDAFFRSGAAFAGWPTEESSLSRICFDESLGISAGSSSEKKDAAWCFLQTFLESEFRFSQMGFPVNQKQLEKMLTEDMNSAVYQLDDKGEYELDKRGERIELAKSTWYSPEWRRHDIYALTDTQRTKLLDLIRHSI